MKTLPLVLIAAILIVVVQTGAYAEANFSASSLNASDVNCKKCHTGTPHEIHAQNSATCENCHGGKLSVAIPQCTKCHDGPIHKVHAGKVSTQTCDYCHKTVVSVHINLTSGAVCSHCHKDIVEVHGKSESCSKCHKTPPEIVKPLKSEGMVLVCQICHPAASVATIHGDVDSKQGCYNCHKGTSNLNGSEVPHAIHETKATCKDCHEDNSKVVIPKCTKCHKIDELHAFGKIGKLTSDLRCNACHPGEVKGTNVAAATKETTKEVAKEPSKDVNNTGTIGETIPATKEAGKVPLAIPTKVPGFGIISGIVVLYMAVRKIRI